MKLQKAINRAFERCNLIGTECDVDAVLLQYKAIRELSEEEYEKVYDMIVDALGLTW